MTDARGSFGYTEREWAFLRLAAPLSGYFVRKQFNEFIGRQSGALGQRFIDRGVRLGHITSVPALGGRTIYHLGGRALYAALGDRESRNRREHQVETIRRRLMALQFVLLDPDDKWLLTEADKRERFSAVGLSLESLPGAIFQGQSKRCFVDKQPIKACEGGGFQFVFIDEGLKTLSAWELFLKGHRPLLKQLRMSEVVFASCDSGRFSGAEELFRSRIAGENAAGSVDVTRLLQYFSNRKAFDEKRFEQFDQNALDQLRENSRVFAGSAWDRLYQRWFTSGKFEAQDLASNQIGFRTALLPYGYEWLSPIHAYERKTICP